MENDGALLSLAIGVFIGAVIGVLMALVSYPNTVSIEKTILIKNNLAYYSTTTNGQFISDGRLKGEWVK